jgi:hypothetical protein
MDGKGFFLGLIAAVVLFLLWKKETSGPFNFLPASPGVGANTGPGGGCAGCGGPSAGAAPSAQAPLSIASGTDGQISPGTPPLQGTLGTGSFYNPSGPTPDNTFLTTPLLPKQVGTTSSVGVAAKVYTNVPGSPTTPANEVPVRAVQTVAPTSQLGFQQRYSFVGIPRTAGARFYVN